MLMKMPQEGNSKQKKTVFEEQELSLQGIIQKKMQLYRVQKAP
jgi:hypothetical protein